MAFRMPGANAFSTQGQTQKPQAREGPDLQEITQSNVAFKTIGGESKVQLLPTPWPVESLPPSTASLLDVISGKGLVAAAGPDTVVLAKTSSVEAACKANAESAGGPFQPEIKLTVPRISQLAFSADENVLVISAESGGGLAAYQVDNVMKGEANPALQLQTNGSALRALVANPAPEKAAYFAAVTVNGQLLVADLEKASLVNGPGGMVLKEGVCCVAWSKRGKQLVAGLGDCTACQMTPDGEVKAIIARPPPLQEGMHMSKICWLEDNVFLVFYSETDGNNCEAFIINREKGTANFEYQRLPEIVGPFGMDRTPPYQFVGRLREFPPSLSDLLLVASTCGSDIGLVSKSEKPLSELEPVTGKYTTTLIDKDHRKAALPFSHTDTSPIGLAIDLSSTSVVLKPLEKLEEMDMSDGPVPTLLVLNNEGVLCAWHVIYTDSILQKKPYPLLTAVIGVSSQQKQVQAPMTSSTGTASTNAQSGFGQQGFGQSAQPSAFGQQAQQSSFGKKSQPSGFGQPAFAQPSLGAPKPAFGEPRFNSTTGSSLTSNTIGGAKPSWVSTGVSNTTGQTPGSGFGKPGFGSPSPLGAGGNSISVGTTPSFGSPAFGKPALSGSQAQNSPAGFGQSGFGQPKPQNPNVGSAGFASFANRGGFSGSGGSPIESKPSATSPFGQPSTARNFSSMDMDTQSAFGTPENKGSKNKGGFSGLGTPSDGFSLGSTFKSDSQPGQTLANPAPDSGFGFGKGFGDILGEPQKSTSQAPTRDENMDEADDSATQNDLPSANAETKNTTTPPSTIIHKKPSATPSLGNLFGTQSQPDTTPASVTNSQPTWTFGPAVSTTPKDPPKTTDYTTTTPSAPKIKTESPSDDEAHTPLRQIPEAPLPPESTSKISYTPGDTSTSSIGSHKSSSADDVPLPPDFAKATQKIEDDAPLPPDWTRAAKPTKDDAPLPPDFTTFGKSAADDSSIPRVPETTANGVSGPLPLPPELSKSNEPTPTNPSEEQIPDGSEELDSTGSWEDGPDGDTEGPEPSEGPESPARTEDVTGDHTEDLKTSPESSFARDDESTGGPFTKISQQPDKSHRLFGEVGKGMPVFLPPRKGPESPRSPSPTRHVLPLNDSLRPDTSRSVSAPTRPHAAIVNRRAELKVHALPQQAPRTLAQIYSEDQRKAQLKSEAASEPEASKLADDGDEELRADLARPPTPTDRLDEFLPHQPPTDMKPASGIPAQIERLYHDINSMLGTLGLNARSLSAFLLYQETIEDGDHKNEVAWRRFLGSDDHKDMIEENWTFSDIPELHFGETVLERMLEDVQLEDSSSKLKVCHDLMGNDIDQLQRKLTSIRKALHAATNTDWTSSVPLSAEQSALQQSLRKGSVTVETKLTEAERSISVLRAKLAEAMPTQENGAVKSIPGQSNSQRKPTVEAVTSTIKKMTSMAERKSSDIAVLEAQLRKLNIDFASSVNGSREPSLEPEGATPYTGRSKFGGSLLSKEVVTPGSIYHTPDSKFGTSAASMRGTLRASMNGTRAAALGDDKAQWRENTKRKKAVNALLREALLARRSKGKEISTVAGWNTFATAAQT